MHVAATSLDWLRASTGGDADDVRRPVIERFRLYAHELDRQVPGSRLTVFAPALLRTAPIQIEAGLASVVVAPIGARWRLAPAFARVVDRLHREDPIDVITTQTPFDDALVALRFAARKGSVAVVQLHVDVFSSAWICEHWANPARRLVARYVCRRASAVRVVSQPLRDAVIKRWGVAPARVSCIPVGVETIPFVFPDAIARIDFRGRGLQMESDAWIVLFVGAMYGPKNLSLLAEVARRACEKIPAARFVIAGDGPDRERFCRSVHELIQTGHVRMIGWLPPERLQRLYAAGDVLVLTSRHESYGRVLIEAQQSGLPVVTTPTAGARQLVDDGLDGLIVRPRAGDFVAAIERLYRDPGLRARLAERGKQRATAGRLTDIAPRLVATWVDAHRRAMSEDSDVA